ncbi:MAG TPA: hypothetical protein VEP89_10775 [Draconibacterium sp.]|nr:hypothetical protein [Draconibacterium sp.]
MNPLAIVGAFIITLSFLAYGIASISLVRFKIIGVMVLTTMSVGIIFDITAIVLMALGAKGITFTFHGMLGAIAFLVMLVDAIWCWKVFFTKGLDAKARKNQILYAKLAYLFWVIAYFTGSLIIIWR